MEKTIVELRSELVKKEQRLEALAQEKKGLEQALEDVKAKMDALFGEGGAGKPAPEAPSIKPAPVARMRKAASKGRARNEGSLKDVIAKAMSGGKAMEIKNVIQAVKSAGYKSNASNFRLIVNQALLKKGSPFKRVGRGKYVLVEKKA